MTFIKKLGINTVQLPHAQGEIAVGRLDQKVIVVVHQTVGMTEPIIPFIDMLSVFRKLMRSWSSLKTAFFSLPREVM